MYIWLAHLITFIKHRASISFPCKLYSFFSPQMLENMWSETAIGQECKVHIDIYLVFDKLFWFCTPFGSHVVIHIFYWIYSWHLLHFFSLWWNNLTNATLWKKWIIWLLILGYRTSFMGKSRPELENLKELVFSTIKQRENEFTHVFVLRPLSAIIQSRTKALEIMLPTLVWVFLHKLTASRQSAMDISAGQLNLHNPSLGLCSDSKLSQDDINTWPSHWVKQFLMFSSVLNVMVLLLALNIVRN